MNIFRIIFFTLIVFAAIAGTFTLVHHKSEQSILSAEHSVVDSESRANEAVSSLFSIIKRLAPERSGIALASPPRMTGHWTLVCAFNPFDKPGGETNRRAFSRTHQIAQFKGRIYVGTGGSDAELGAGRIWAVTEDGCQDVTPWGDFADRTFSLYATERYLYASACKFSGGAEIWRNDGTSWEKVHTFSKEVDCVLRYTVFNGSLCAAVAIAPSEGAPLVCEINGQWKEVWRSPAHQVYSLQPYKDQLYVGTSLPAQLWRTKDLKTFERVDDQIWQSSVSIIETMTVFDDHLILGLGRTPTIDPLAPTVLAFDGNKWSGIGHQPKEWLASHNFNASTTFNNTLIVSMGSGFNRMTVWALADNSEWYAVGGRVYGDWGGIGSAYRQFTGEWIYDLQPIDGSLYVSFSGDPGRPALWRFTPDSRPKE